MAIGRASYGHQYRANTVVFWVLWTNILQRNFYQPSDPGHIVAPMIACRTYCFLGRKICQTSKGRSLWRVVGHDEGEINYN